MAHNGALIYIGIEKHGQRDRLQVQRKHVIAESVFVYKR